MLAFMALHRRTVSSGRMSYVLMSLPLLTAAYNHVMKASREILEFRDALFDIRFTPSYPEVNEFFQVVLIQSSTKPTNYTFLSFRHTSEKERIVRASI